MIKTVPWFSFIQSHDEVELDLLPPPPGELPVWYKRRRGNTLYKVREG